MTRALAAALLLLVPTAAMAQQAPAPAGQAAPAGQDTYDMPCSMFHANADGSWNATQPMTLQPAAGPIALQPSYKFKAGTLFAGFDLGSELDKACKR